MIDFLIKKNRICSNVPSFFGYGGMRSVFLFALAAPASSCKKTQISGHTLQKTWNIGTKIKKLCESRTYKRFFVPKIFFVPLRFWNKLKK